MKNSNKLLVGGFLSVLLLITAIHVSLYAKYKSGDYTLYNEEDDLQSQTMQSFPNILFVTVRNVPYATVRFSDVAAVEKGEEKEIAFVQKGDTLLVTGNSSNNEGIDAPLSFQVPVNATLMLENSSLSFEPGKNTVVNNPVFQLNNSRAVFSGRQNFIKLGQVKVVATNNSMALFQGNTAVNQLDVQLSNSLLEYGEGKLDSLSVTTDSLSRISLPTKHLTKATIRTNTQ